VDPTGLPVGAFYSTHYTSRSLSFVPGDTIVLYTDGLSEARNLAGAEYGSERIAKVLSANSHLGPRELAATCLDDLAAHLDGVPRADDLTLMVVRRSA